MLFQSIEFAIFLPIVFLLYWFVFRKLLQQNILMVVVRYFNVNSSAFHIYEQFLDDCNKRNIQVIMVLAPLYMEMFEKMDNLEESYTTYRGLAHKFGTSLLDYTYDELSYDTTYFYNATHLNKAGATIFSQKLALQIDSLNYLK